MELKGALWIFFAALGSFWHFRELKGALWSSRELYEDPRSSRVLSGALHSSKEQSYPQEPYSCTPSGLEISECLPSSGH